MNKNCIFCDIITPELESQLRRSRALLEKCSNMLQSIEIHRENAKIPASDAIAFMIARDTWEKFQIEIWKTVKAIKNELHEQK